MALRDLRAIFSAAAHAQRAADYLHGLQPPGFRRGRLPGRRAGAMNPPDTIMIDGRTYSWRWLCEIRRRLLDAWKAARRSSLPCSILRTTAARLGNTTPLGKRKRAAATLP